MADLVQWLRTQLNEDEAAAEDTLSLHVRAGRFRGVDVQRWRITKSGTGIIDEDGGTLRAQQIFPAEATHVIRHDPARVLREIEAKRGLLADVLAEPHFRNEEDNWYTCAALTDEDGDPVCLDESRAPGPCDCGRDARVARRVRLLALPFEDRPGFAEAIASAE